MSVEELEKAIAALPVAERWRLHDWLQERMADEWDHQMTRDAESGKLDKLFEGALEDYKAGRVKEI